jgi:hypothetical protein
VPRRGAARRGGCARAHRASRARPRRSTSRLSRRSRRSSRDQRHRRTHDSLKALYTHIHTRER